MTFVGELPASTKPWKLQAFGNVIVLINEEHEPMIFADGKLQPLSEAPIGAIPENYRYEFKS